MSSCSIFSDNCKVYFNMFICTEIDTESHKQTPKTHVYNTKHAQHTKILSKFSIFLSKQSKNETNISNVSSVYFVIYINS